MLPTSSSPYGLLRNPSRQPFVPNPSVVYHTYQTANLRAKNQSPVTSLSWTPGGRRLITGNADGEFCLWDGNSFQFELIMSAHNTAFRAQTWARSGSYLITTSNRGNIKYWTTSIAPVVSFDAHDQSSINSVSFSPSDNKFVTCGDDRAVNIFDFETQKLERNLAGHGWDVKTCEWHPGASVVASGGKDNLVKLWDPRSGSNLATLYGHKNTVSKVSWSPNGNWLLTASRDQMIKLYDIREMKELCSFKGHYKEVTSLAWHPQFETVFASGGMDGTLLFWNVGPKGSEEPAARVPFAHDMAIWDMEWHPSGHSLATASNDKTTKIWCRPRPGDPMAFGAHTEWFNDVPGEPDVKDFDENEILFDEIEVRGSEGSERSELPNVVLYDELTLFTRRFAHRSSVLTWESLSERRGRLLSACRGLRGPRCTSTSSVRSWRLRGQQASWTMSRSALARCWRGWRHRCRPRLPASPTHQVRSRPFTEPTEEPATLQGFKDLSLPERT